MSKSLFYLVVTLAVIGASLGGYYLYTETHVVKVDVSTSPPNPSAGSNDPARPKPDHGQFEQRFQPKPPPANGGKSN
jgi:hypothetical protein